MVRHWHSLTPSGDAFLKSAPFCYVHSIETTVSVERLWEVLAGDALVRWVRVFTGLRWVSPHPFGVGTVREVTLLGMFTARERFFRWGEGHRFTFSVFEASLPGLRRAAEDWIIEPTPSGSRLTWTMAIEPHRLATPLLWISSPLIGLMNRRALRTIRIRVGS
ncbi:SRPBCC family protein [Streptomyces sp. NBC_01408]|uniref:SRPBCC family protein n=1 Tax=Streptomyces sp. NBC_01408 TaxID=2903855 RepID=UPI00225576DD|nr:SRPBCC family protein [Streptomyces sp. NBC_01408]MCX4695666.1 SRPBCC family protein [Streptomyces sp. NBC_01408]